MHCDTCTSNTYFQNTSSTNCIPKPETRYYIDVFNGYETLFPCYPSCLTCVIGGDDDINNCLLPKICVINMQDIVFNIC